MDYHYHVNGKIWNCILRTALISLNGKTDKAHTVGIAFGAPPPSSRIARGEISGAAVHSQRIRRREFIETPTAFSHPRGDAEGLTKGPKV